MFFLALMVFFILSISGIHFATVGEWMASLLSLAGAGLISFAGLFLRIGIDCDCLGCGECTECSEYGDCVECSYCEDD